MSKIEFLDLEIVLMIHRKQTQAFGGDDTVPRIELLESALAQPEQTFEDRFLHEPIWEMAAAYTYHIAKNHPFADGNKRTALNAALLFLSLNGLHLYQQDMRLFEATYAVASGSMDKTQLAKAFEEIYSSRRK